MSVSTTSYSRADLERMAASVPSWYHSIALGQGVTTPGYRTAADLAAAVEALRLPDLRGRELLDINGWDGFFSFEAERRGASRVVALDRMMWAMDQEGWRRYWLECREKGVAPADFQDTPFWHPESVPGKAGFDTAHRALGSRVESVVGDLMEMDVSTLGRFDVVLYLGSLYHMDDPVEAMRRVAAVTGGMAIIETEAVAFPGYQDRALWEFFPFAELNNDSSNWWAPNEKALIGICRAAGFREVEVVAGLGTMPARRRIRSLAAHLLGKVGIRRRRDYASSRVIRYRAVVHAFK